MASAETSYQSVLNFWFPEEKSLKEKQELWFFGGPVVDKAIKDKFGGLITQACNGELSHWEDLSEGTMAGFAFVILLDQFCRNIYRGTAEAFQNDPKALNVTLKLIESGRDNELSYQHRAFLYLPLEHCEDKEIQEKSILKFQELAKEAQDAGADEITVNYLNFSTEFAKQHQEVITKFGRFPKRNVALGRENTPDENEALKNWPYKF